jgi:hypothetical protein
LRRNGRAAGVVEPFQQADPQTGAGQVRGRDETVVAAPDDYGVGVGRMAAQLR